MRLRCRIGVHHYVYDNGAGRACLFCDRRWQLNWVRMTWERVRDGKAHDPF